MQKYSLSVEDLDIGLSELLNTNFEHNVQENLRKQRSGQNVDEVLWCRAEKLGVAFDKIKDNSHGTRELNLNDSKLQPTEWDILSKDRKMGNPYLRNEMKTEEKSEKLSASFDGKQKEKPETAELDFFTQKTPKFLNNIALAKTNTSQQLSQWKTENDNRKSWRLNENRSKTDCSTQVAANSNTVGTVRSMKETTQFIIRENAKKNAKPKLKSELRTLTKTAEHEKLSHSGQIVTNKVKNVLHLRRFSTPFSLRSMPRPGANYKLISIYEDSAQLDKEKYPDRSKLFSPTPPRKEKGKPNLPNLKELELRSLHCKQSLSSCQKSERQQETLNATPESLGHKEFETTLASTRLFQHLSEGFSRRRSYEAVSSRKESSASTKHVLTMSPTQTHYSKLAVPLLSRQRKGESSVTRVTNVEFDSPIYEQNTQ